MDLEVYQKQKRNRNCQKNCYIYHIKINYLYKIISIKKMSKVQFGQFCEMTFEQFLAKSNQIHCKVIGTVESVTKHKKFIVEVYEDKKSIIRSYKRFSQFETLYQLLKVKFPAYEIEEFPSRFQIFGKEETRKSYFQNLLSQIIKDYGKQRDNVGMCKDLIKIIYNFLCDHIIQQKNRRQTINKKKLENKENVPISFETDAVSENGKKVMKKKLQNTFQQQGVKIERRASIDTYSPTVRISRTRSNSTIDAASILVPAEPEIPVYTYDNEFQIKFSNEQCWKLGYIEIRNSSLYVFKNKIDSHFKTCIELYRIKVQYLKRDPNLFDHICQRGELDLTRTFNENQQILSLYHQYDHHKILIRKPVQQNPDLGFTKFNLESLKNKIKEASQIQQKSMQFEGVFSPIGKLFIFIHKLNCEWKKFSQKQKIFLRIKTGTLIHHTMPITYNRQCDINQGFMLPISNTFERIRIQCYTGKDMKDQGNVIGTFKFSMVQFFTKPDRSLIERLEVVMDNSDGKEQTQYSTKVQLSLENLSDFSSLYSNSFANQNDGFPLKQISGLDDIESFSIATDRILTIIGTISLAFQAFQRNVLKFKYPILGYAFFTFVLINVAFVPVTYILRQLMFFALIGILYQQEHVRIIIDYLMSKYIFSYLHPDFKTPQILSTGQAANLKRSNLMIYIAEDYEYNDGNFQKKNKKKRDVHYFEKHGKVFAVPEEQQSFFEKMREFKSILEMVYTIVNSIAFTIEKVANLLSWVDTRKTILVAMIVLIMTGLASGTTLQLIICGVCAAKLAKGTSYYHHKLYQNNRRLAIYTLRYILQKDFPNLIGKPSLTKNMSQFQLTQYISDIVFPINGQSSAKKLKQQLSRLIGVYLQLEFLNTKCTKENNLKLVYLIDIIETCEDKLSLKLAVGEEGVSNDFQQLIEQTKDVEDIDDWFKQAAKNFVLNIPSRMFLVFHRKQLNKIEKAQIKQNQDKQPIQETEPSFINDIPQAQLKQVRQQQAKDINKVDENVLNAEMAKQRMIILKQVSLQ